MISSTSKRVAIYARVSTGEQHPENQLRELREYVERRGWALAEVFVDHGVSGAKDRRPELDRLMEAAKRRKIDVVLIWALDRLGRSLRHLVLTAEQFGAWGVDLVAYTQPIDTTTATGKLTFQILGAVAEFERELIRERINAGLRRARAEGKRIGRPPVALNIVAARERLTAGRSVSQVARELRVSRRSLRRALDREQDNGDDPGENPTEIAS